jgi:hypothetical protein
VPGAATLGDTLAAGLTLKTLSWTTACHMLLDAADAAGAAGMAGTPPIDLADVQRKTMPHIVETLQALDTWEQWDTTCDVFTFVRLL